MGTELSDDAAQAISDLANQPDDDADDGANAPDSDERDGDEWDAEGVTRGIGGSAAPVVRHAA
tara:strand:- start:2187 stop:2375 length:189 start_codon:yes stop_codon:yes gene_type:complete